MVPLHAADRPDGRAMNDTQDLQQLLAQRDRLTHRLRAHHRMISALRLISCVALPVFLVWAVFAWRAGAIDIGMTAWMVPLALLFAFILTREFRFQDKSSSGEDSHPSALTEPDVRLSPHPAPTLQPPAAHRVATGQIDRGPAARCAPASALTHVLGA